MGICSRSFTRFLSVALAFSSLADAAFQKLAPFGGRSHVASTRKLSMVAGGAERAYGDEYYDGKKNEIIGLTTAG